MIQSICKNTQRRNFNFIRFIFDISSLARGEITPFYVYTVLLSSLSDTFYHRQPRFSKKNRRHVKKGKKKKKKEIEGKRQKEFKAGGKKERNKRRLSFSRVGTSLSSLVTRNSEKVSFSRRRRCRAPSRRRAKLFHQIYRGTPWAVHPRFASKLVRRSKSLKPGSRNRVLLPARSCSTTTLPILPHFRLSPLLPRLTIFWWISALWTAWKKFHT